MTLTASDQNFLKVIPLLLLLEGGYVNDPRDPGGETKYGISKRAYPSLDIANLSQEQAANIYYTDYWIKGQCQAIPAPLCAYHFDACVNQGIAAANKILQQTVGVKEDGVVGPVTLQACARLPSAQHYLYLVNRFAHYRGLAGWEVYGTGWTNRLLHLASCLSLV